MNVVLPMKREEWKEAKSQGRKTGPEPKWKQKDFITWAQKQVSSIQEVAYSSATVLVKIALGLHPGSTEFIAGKFSGSETDSELAISCFTRASLGEGAFWNKKHTSEHLQLWWIKV